MPNYVNPGYSTRKPVKALTINSLGFGLIFKKFTDASLAPFFQSELTAKRTNLF